MITMHDLLQEMGREVVRQESIKDPGKRSRLWHHDDIYEVLTKNTGTEAIEGISLDMSKIKEIYLNPYTLTRMYRLRFVKFYSSLHGENKIKVHHFQGLESVFSELRYLHWHGYPLKSLPSNIHPKNLISLEMPHSNIEQLWNGVQHLSKLKHINVSNSKQLTKIPDLSLAPNLENMNLEGCTNLIETHSSIQYLNKLVILNLRQCQSLNSLPKSFEFLCRVVILNLENCSRLENLPNSICKLKSLQHFNLSGCSKLETLPEKIGDLEALKELKAERTTIREVPSSIVCLRNLGRLSLERDKDQPQMILQLPNNVSGLHVLTNLNLTNCGITELPESLGQLSCLKILFLDKNNFERIPESIIYLPKLFWLNISYCERLQSLPELPWDITDMEAQCCTSLQALASLSTLFTPTSWNSQTFNFINCFKLDRTALRKIVKDALQKIRVMATEWTKENDKDLYEQPPRGSLSFPGREIPVWFTFKSLGSSITLKLSPGWFNDNFASFALCAVVAFRDHRDNNGKGLRVVCECKLKSSEDTNRWHLAFGYLDGWGDGYSGPESVGSDHVFLGYDFDMYSDNGVSRDFYYNYTLASIQFYLQDIDDNRLDCCKVTKCAVCPLYAEDYGEFMEKPGRSFSSDTDDEEEPRPKRQKFFRFPSWDGPFVASVFR